MRWRTACLLTPKNLAALDTVNHSLPDSLPGCGLTDRQRRAARPDGVGLRRGFSPRPQDVGQACRPPRYERARPVLQQMLHEYVSRGWVSKNFAHCRTVAQKRSTTHPLEISHIENVLRARQRSSPFVA